MKHLKKSALLFSSLLCVSLSVLLAGCGSPSSTIIPPQDITLEFWTLQLRDFRPLITQWIQDYEQSHPHTHIHWVDVPFAEGEKRALTAMLSPQVPDVINLNPAFASTLAERHALLKLSPFLSPAIESRYAPALMTYSLFQNELISIPWYTTTTLRFENTALSHETKDAYVSYPLWTSGGNLLKGIALSKAPPQTFKAFKDTVKTLLDPVKRDLHAKRIPAECLTGQYANALELFMAGRLRYLDAGSSALKVIKTNAPHVYHTMKRIDARLQNNRTIDASPMVLVVPKRAQHPQEAVDFAVFITQSKYQIAFSQVAPVLPSTLEGLRHIQNTTTATDLAQDALVASANKILEAQQGIRPRSEQAVLNDLANAVAQSYLLNQPEENIHYTQRLWDKMNLQSPSSAQ